MAGAEGINGAGKPIWALPLDTDKKTIKEQGAGGLGVNLGPHENFLKAIQSAYSATSGTETVTHTNNI